MESSHQAPKSLGDAPRKKRSLPQSSEEIGPDEDEILEVQAILEPYSKDQIVEFLCDAALSDPAIYSRIRIAAERDVSHRKVFIHGLPWDATKEMLSEVFSSFGSIEECNVVVDKATGRCKGYGFVLFESRSGAVKALKQPNKQIGSRTAHCQLASVGPTASSSGSTTHHGDTAGRKIYISNVNFETNADKLRVFFSKFGEIEAGPMGFETATGKSRGYAIFLYRSQDGARKALEEPYKMFEGHRLHCQWATDPAKSISAGIVGAAPQQLLSSLSTSRNLSLYNPTPLSYATILSQNPLLAAATGINPSLIGGIPAYGINPTIIAGYNNQIAAGLLDLGHLQPSILRPGSSYTGMRS